MIQTKASTLTKSLNLLFPQWQGAGNPDLRRGANLLQQAINKAIEIESNFIEVPVASTYSLSVADNVLGLTQISAQLSSACDIIADQNPERIFTIGGDCGVEIAPISFLNQKYRDLAVIWLDAHGDLNTPESSPSKHFHGMPLRALLGEGSFDIVQKAFSQLSPQQVFLVGVRELDRPEREFIKQNRLATFSADAINEGSHNLFCAIAQSGFRKLYIHLYLDVIDPLDFPYVTCRTPNGIRIENLKRVLNELKDKFEVVGSSILEFLPTQSEPSSLSPLIQLAEIIR